MATAKQNVDVWALRRLLGLSAAELGFLLGVRPQSVYRWERGARPRADARAELAALRGLGGAEATARLRWLRSHSVPGRIERFIDRLAVAHELTNRHLAVVRLHLQGRTHSELARDLAISPNTLKVHIKELLRRCATSSLGDLRRTFLREAGGLSLPPPGA